MECKTHLQIDEKLCGTITSLEKNAATVEMKTTKVMSSDKQGLIHGGFIFGMADYAAMAAVNDPNVVLGSAETRFLKPVSLGQTVTAQAKVLEEKGKKRMVEVTVLQNSEPVFTGNFTCFVLENHILEA